METYQLLEYKFGGWINNPNTVAVSSGTSALHLALESLQLPIGSKVAVPEFTMVACARAVTMAGLYPVFVDCTNDLLIDVSKIPTDVDVIMPVHIYGRRCDMDAIHSLGKLVLEDMAEIHGVDPDRRSDAACWSFYKNKIIAGEEGGMIAFKDPQHARVARLLRSQGFTEQHDFMHMPRGINARLSNAHAELILKSFKNYEQNVKDRRELERKYDRLVPGKCRMPERQAPWVYDIQMSAHRVEGVIQFLKEKGVQVRHAFKPMSMQPEYLGAYTHLNAYKHSQELFYVHYTLSDYLLFASWAEQIFNTSS